MSALTVITIPIRVPADAAGIYRKLVDQLDAAATAANDKGAALTGDQRLEWLRVRDALRTAAGRAYSTHQTARTPRCRRCGVDCPGCAPTVDETARARVNAHVATLTGHPAGCPCNGCADARAAAVEIEATR